MGSDRDDELGRTATAVGSTPRAPVESTPSAPLGPTLGRYRLERELGAGGMGVVHAAFDPDLERRIALKVLRGDAAPGAQAKDRLLREARAMARLAHSNVVTVYEVGTAGGRDFVAMELITGETLADWLRASPRPPRAILDAFVAAGRGLAAAHAAGIVHRDFKPHNVLRSRDGRIVVTDFGLAREAEAGVPPQLEATLPVGSQLATATATPSSLAGITVAGSLLGTPAYMAPEQWSGGAVTPATDQFAYCVALWEALVGERPYRGPTLDDLRAQVNAGPEALDVSKLPRRLRATLRRGLDPDPARRWPSMDALLSRLVRAERRTGAALAIAGGVALAATATIFIVRGSGTAAPDCEPPARELAAVWTPAIADQLRAKTSAAHVEVIERDLARWRTARTAGCAAPPATRGAQLQCLDGVLARVDVIRKAFERVPKATAEDLLAELIEPELCTRKAPRLTMQPTPDVIEAYALFTQSQTDTDPTVAQLDAVFDKPNVDPCARVITVITYENVPPRDTLRQRMRLADAITAADQCGDERLRADVLVYAAPYEFELPMIGPKGEAALKRAQVAAGRVSQPDVDAIVASLGAGVARLRGRAGDAIKLMDAAIAGYGQRGLARHQLRAAASRNELREWRAEPGDVDAIRAEMPRWRAAAKTIGAYENRLAAQDARARFWLGDPAAHVEVLALWDADKHALPAGGSRDVEGDVVDATGHPIAGATVASAALLTSDSHGVGLPIGDFDGGFRRTTTDAAGRFKITGTSLRGSVQAQLGALRSPPVPIADRVHLVLAPTRRLAGKADLGTTPSSKVVVEVLPWDHPTDTYQLLATVAPDGTFTVDGAPTTAAQIGICNKNYMEMRVDLQTVPASTASLTDLKLTFRSTGRVLDVIVRSTVTASFEGAQTLMIPGAHAIASMVDLMQLKSAGISQRFARPIVHERIPGPAIDQVRPGDLVAHYTDAPLGELTVCAIGFQGDLIDPATRQRLQSHAAELKFKCERVAADAKVVTVVAPPQERFEK